MKKIDLNSAYNKKHRDRFERTLRFLAEAVPPPARILDLGPANPFSEILTKQGYEVKNTPEGLDLDLDYEVVRASGYDLVTGFEILEHLVSPFPLLNAITAPKLMISVPLRLWFASAYWNENDPYDRHYHEFEPRQLEMLLDKAGWQIKEHEKWKSYELKPGIRPILRMLTPRHYIVYCERKQQAP